LPVELREADIQRVLGTEVHVSVRTDYEKPSSLERASHILQQLESRRVSPLKIVEDDHQRTVKRAQQPRDRLEEANALLLRAQPFGLGVSGPGESGTTDATIAALSPTLSGKEPGPSARAYCVRTSSHGAYGGRPSRS
jgi:hypothetical protein